MKGYEGVWTYMKEYEKELRGMKEYDSVWRYVNVYEG